MPVITRRLEFDAAHRILNHESKCRHIHGHRYVVEITAQSNDLDELGRVIDFSVIKSVVGTWIDNYWDHNIILHPDDPLLNAVIVTGGDSVGPSEECSEPIWQGKRPYVMPEAAKNPTVENMAFVLFHQARFLLDKSTASQVTLKSIRLYETPSCWADYPG